MYRSALNLSWWERLTDWWYGMDREVAALICAQRAYLEARRMPGDPRRTAELGRHNWERAAKAQRHYYEG